MANNPYVNKVVKADGTTIIDISDTTAAAADVAVGKYFYTADGAKTQGTSSGGGIIISDTADPAGGTVRTITAANAIKLQLGSATPTTTEQEVSPPAGVDGFSKFTVGAVPSGTAGTPTATKGTVSNHSVTVTPSVTNTAGYISGGTKTGTGVTVSASELISFSTIRTGSGAPSSSLGVNGDIYIQTS